MTLLTASLVISNIVGIAIVIVGGIIWANMKTINHNILRESQIIRERLAEIKTRMADEERDDQKAKARARYNKHHQHGGK